MTVVDNLDAVLPRTGSMRSTFVSSVCRDEPTYPVRLRRVLPLPPARLFFRGSLPPAERVVAIVGSRAATRDGCRRALALADGLARRGYAVVSGGAFGIDAAAHRGALEAGAPTFAILGCGVDVVYPDRHGRLFAQIADGGGGLLSEYPAGTAPRAGNFPARNRLIAALADAVVVVEAGFRSGALITAGWARRLKLPLLAMAGSVGTDRLLRSRAARLIRDTPEAVQDVVDALLDPLAGRAQMDAAVPDDAESGPLAPLLSILAEGSRGAQDVARRLELPLHEVMNLISQAELAGRVSRLPGGQYEVSRVQ